ncbi:hypothetical protein ACQFX9_05555 [Aliinostoc sp. HNIBRCY26]|uniref:hypothetical protein n=1 Tax=Aliinostoc sp. HNIBRCY26 TaxID=3418997 RepID=UPI003D0695CF
MLSAELENQFYLFPSPQSPIPSEALSLSKCPQSPIPSPQSPVPSPQSPVPNPQSPVPNPQSPKIR